VDTADEAGTVITAMAHNLLSPLSAQQLVRVTLDNNVGGDADVNALIGRTAHICYVEDALSASVLVRALAPYLQ
jgi:hypothetical protein